MRNIMHTTKIVLVDYQLKRGAIDAIIISNFPALAILAGVNFIFQRKNKTTSSSNK